MYNMAYKCTKILKYQGCQGHKLRKRVKTMKKIYQTVVFYIDNMANNMYTY